MQIVFEPSVMCSKISVAVVWIGAALAKLMASKSEGAAVGGKQMEGDARR